MDAGDPVNDEHEMESLYAAEELISKVLYDLDLGAYMVTVCESSVTGKRGELGQSLLEVREGSTFMRNAYLALSRLYDVSVALDGGYLILSKLRGGDPTRPSAVWVWYVRAGTLTPLHADGAYEVVVKAKGPWYVKKGVVHTAWKSKMPT